MVQMQTVHQLNATGYIHHIPAKNDKGTLCGILFDINPEWDSDVMEPNCKRCLKNLESVSLSDRDFILRR